MATGRRVVPVDGVGTGASGRACLYVLPCAYEDHAKLGIATDPLARMQAFSPRYYAFFDLDRGWLAEAGSLREARAWETRWKRALRDHAAPPPLQVPAQAAGHTEWFRGALSILDEARYELASQGFVVHAPMRAWIARRLREQRERLHSGEQAAVAHFGAPDAWPAAAAWPPLARLRDALDAYAALGIDLDDAMSPSLHAWLARNTLLSR
ncbi:GIY-YIG nuclease family protein [uncultured Pseudoxanthomonas sp.]|uniref:GIY-YIG nuclease family protein n=1 Tax=uncultured Pseudoxanthomonas sp. TaxID=281701 RepID=UPI00261A7569|nr:GIY-YIG nuclease family protein [uncultured Pseudoxanthomonas sp.]